MADNETTADVIAAMRDEAARADMEQGYSLDDAAEMMREFASRVDAAAKRMERAHKKELETKDAVIQTEVAARESERDAHKRENDELKKQVGNSAALREALSKINSLCGIGVVEISSFEIGSICDNALSSPPRNCDRFECATSKTAQDVWRREDGGKTAYYEWLLAIATEQEGGAK